MTARILIVDDVPANTRLLKAKLTAEYYEAEAAPDGTEAIRTAQVWQPDLILLDVMMPGLDGYETCRILKAGATTRHIPVVMITALGDASERLLGLEAGADDFLTKPVEFDTLLARVRGLVRLKRMLDEWRVRGETARALGLAAEDYVEPSIEGARALVVDASDAAARTVEDALYADRVECKRARDAAEALHLTGQGAFELIVLNLSMEGADPLRLASRLRAEPATQETPLVLVAKPAQRDMLLRGFDLGANDWVVQPLDANELRVRARNQIRRKYYQDRLRQDLGHALELALTDPMTGLHNHRYLMRHLRGLLSAGSPPGVAAMMIDVDHFKQVNDRWGHGTGDRVLKTVANILRGRTRVFDSLARYGGEEFAVVMAGASAADALNAAERLREAVQDTVFSQDGQGPHGLTVSIGIARSGTGRTTPQALLDAADAALYAAKRAGRNRVEMAPDP